MQNTGFGGSGRPVSTCLSLVGTDTHISGIRWGGRAGQGLTQDDPLRVCRYVQVPIAGAPLAHALDTVCDALGISSSSSVELVLISGNVNVDQLAQHPILLDRHVRHVPHPLSHITRLIDDPSLVIIHLDADDGDRLYQLQSPDAHTSDDQVAVHQDRLSAEARAAVCERFCAGRWDHFDRMGSVVSPGGSVGMDDKQYLIPTPGEIIRLNSGVVRAEYADLRVNSRLAIEASVFEWRRRLCGVVGSDKRVVGGAVGWAATRDEIEDEEEGEDGTRRRRVLLLDDQCHIGTSLPSIAATVLDADIFTLPLGSGHPHALTHFGLVLSTLPPHQTPPSPEVVSSFLHDFSRCSQTINAKSTSTLYTPDSNSDSPLSSPLISANLSHPSTPSISATPTSTLSRTGTSTADSSYPPTPRDSSPNPNSTPRVRTVRFADEGAGEYDDALHALQGPSLLPSTPSTSFEYTGTLDPYFPDSALESKLAAGEPSLPVLLGIASKDAPPGLAASLLTRGEGLPETETGRSTGEGRGRSPRSPKPRTNWTALAPVLIARPTQDAWERGTYDAMFAEWIRLKSLIDAGRI